MHTHARPAALAARLLSLGAAIALSPFAHADAVIFDNYTGRESLYSSSGSRDAGSAPLVQLRTASTGATVTSFSYRNWITTEPGRVKFVIYKDPAAAPVYTSFAVVVPVESGYSWKTIPGISYTLTPNSTYYFGVVANVAAKYPYYFGSTQYTQNGLSSGHVGSPGDLNGNVDSYDTPDRNLFSRGGAELPLLLVGTLPTLCGPADIAKANGDIGADGALTASDVVLFFSSFFSGCSANPGTPCTPADIAKANGDLGPDGNLSASDVVAFFNSFFAGCS